MQKSEFNLWLEKHVPLALRDEAANLFDERPNLMDYINEARALGYKEAQKRFEEELQTAKYQIEGLRLAIQDKIEIVSRTTHYPRCWYQFWK